MSSMTTSMNDIVDFVRILNEQPEWADTIRGILLGQELLDLPRQLAQFVQATNERLGRLETDVADLKAGQARLENSVGQLDTRVGRLEGKVGRLEGSDLEREVHGNIVNIASRGLGLNRARILQSKIIPRGTELQDAIDDAEEQGIITEDQGSHLELSDVIIAARRKSDRQECYVVAEVSLGSNDGARSRAKPWHQGDAIDRRHRRSSKRWPTGCHNPYFATCAARRNQATRPTSSPSSAGGRPLPRARPPKRNSLSMLDHRPAPSSSRNAGTLASGRPIP